MQFVQRMVRASHELVNVVNNVP